MSSKISPDENRYQGLFLLTKIGVLPESFVCEGVSGVGL
jgi:hypothetical protein